MIPLIFILAVTGLSIYVNILIDPDVSWINYYRGGIIGLVASAAVLYVVNQRRRKKELEEFSRRP